MAFERSGENSAKRNKHPALILGGIDLVSSLKGLGIPLYVGSGTKDNPARYSRFAKRSFNFSGYDSPAFISELCELGRSFSKKPVIFSDDDQAVLNIAQNRERLKPYYLFRFPPGRRVKEILDGSLFCGLIDRYDLPAPKSVALSSVHDLQEGSVSNFNWPCMIKPAFNRCRWNGDLGEKEENCPKALKCDTYGELVKKYKRIAAINSDVVIQEFIEGEEEELYSVNMYIGGGGELKGYFIAQKLRTSPPESGKGCYIKTVEDAEMIDKARSIADKLDLKGLLNIRFKREKRSGKPVLLKVHPRNSAWSYLGTAAGVNLAALYYRDLDGSRPHKILTYTPDLPCIFLEKDIRAFAQNLRERKVPVSKWIRSYFRKSVLSGFRWSDPLPHLMRLWFFIRRRVKMPPIPGIFPLPVHREKQAEIRPRHQYGE